MTPNFEGLPTKLNTLIGVEGIDLGNLDAVDLRQNYFSIVNNGGVISVSEIQNGYMMKDKYIPSKVVDRLLRKGLVGIYNKNDSEVLLFDNLDPLISDATNHPIGVAAFYELKKSNYQEKYLPLLMEGILLRYNKLKKVLHAHPCENIASYEDRMLATSIALTCRGEYQCPKGMREYFKRAGGLSAVVEAGRLIGERLRYDSDERIKSYLRMLQMTFPKLDSNFTKKFLELWRDEKAKLHSKQVSAAYAGGLAWCASELTGHDIDKTKIAKEVLTTAESLGSRAKEISKRQGLSLFNENITVAPPEEISVISK